MTGLWLLLAARLVWGLSFAALNLTHQSLTTANPHGASRRAGMVRTIIAFGPTFGLLIGAPVAWLHGPKPVFLILAALACLAPLAALRLPSRPEPQEPRSQRFGRPDALTVWGFSMGAAIDGIFIFGLGLLAASRFPDEAVLAAGLVLLFRNAAAIFLSPVGGQLGQRHGAARALVWLSFATAAALGLLCLPGPLLWVGMIAVVVLRTLTIPLVAPAVAEYYPGDRRIPALVRQFTWSDIGAATGPLIAGLVFPVMRVEVIYSATAAIVALATLALARSMVAAR